MARTQTNPNKQEETLFYVLQMSALSFSKPVTVAGTFNNTNCCSEPEAAPRGYNLPGMTGGEKYIHIPYITRPQVHV